MEWKRTPDELVKFFEEKTAPIDCERRKMFGYPCCFIGGNMFTGTFGVNIFIRLGEKDRKRALEAHGDMKAFEPVPGRKMGEYLVVPEEVRLDAAAFDDLLKRSVEYARSLPPKPKKRKGPR